MKFFSRRPRKPDMPSWASKRSNEFVWAGTRWLLVCSTCGGNCGQCGSTGRYNDFNDGETVPASMDRLAENLRD